MERKQQILLKPPVKEGTDLCHVPDTQHSRLSEADQGLLHRRDQPVIGIPVDKYLYAAALQGSFRYLFCRQKDPCIRSRIRSLCQINTVRFSADNDQLLWLSKFNHEKSPVIIPL